MSKTVSSIAVVILLTFGLAEGVSRLLVVEEQGVDYLLGRKWRYILPFSYRGDGSVAASSDSSGYRVYDSLLGWSHGSWKHSEFYFSDGRGYRCGEKAFNARVATPERHDIVCIGNSFTHGDAVAHEDTWPHILSESTGRTVLNMGVGGYGIDQAVLRFMRSGQNCDTVILGLVPGDLERSLTTVYNYYTGGVKTKPRFVFNRDGSHTLLNVPCLTPAEFVARPLTARAEAVYRGIAGYNGYVSKEGEWWTGSMFLRLAYSSLEQARHRRPPVYMTAGEDLDYCLGIFEVLKRHCDSVGAVPIVLLIDNLNSIGDRGKSSGNTWSLLQARLKEMGIVSHQFQDSILRAYEAAPANVIHPTEKVHYSPDGNRLLAGLLAKRL